MHNEETEVDRALHHIAQHAQWQWYYLVWDWAKHKVGTDGNPWFDFDSWSSDDWQAFMDGLAEQFISNVRAGMRASCWIAPYLPNDF